MTSPSIALPRPYAGHRRLISAASITSYGTPTESRLSRYGAGSISELIEAMSADSRVKLSELRVDGGASACNLLMQMQADLLGVPVVRPRITETTALGAAYLAGLAVGFWEDEAEIASLWSRDRVFEPTLSLDAARARLDQWKRAVERSREWDQA